MATKYSILFQGDVSLCNIDHTEFVIQREILEQMERADLVVANLECPITESTSKKPLQTINMSATPSSLEILRGADVVSLSNNHIQDFQTEGINDTKRALKEYNIPYFGIGKTFDEALEPFVTKIGNTNIAILGATRYANAYSGIEGTAPDDCSKLFRKIKQLKKDGYFVILYFHWGYEYVRIPSPRERSIAHKCIDLGADFVVGSHPHIFQGIEKYRDKWIVYSLGNYIFHSSLFEGLSFIPNDPRLRKSYMVKLNLSEDGKYNIELIGYETTDQGVCLLEESETRELIAEVEDCSKNLMDGCKWKYLKEYYAQTANISGQNVKVRNNYQHAQSLGLWKRLSLYRNANAQDAKNRLGGVIINMLR